MIFRLFVLTWKLEGSCYVVKVASLFANVFILLFHLENDGFLKACLVCSAATISNSLLD